jgi:SPP1 family phage portal protein
MIYQVQASNTDINKVNVAEWITSFKNEILPNRIKLGEYYDGKNKIVKQGAVKDRPNYSINVNMAKYIIDVATSYTFGAPIVYSTKDESQEAILEKIKYILKNCGDDEVDFQQGGDMATYGVSYQLLLAIQGSEKIEDRIRIKYLSPLSTFYVIDNTILENPVCAIYMYDYTENNTKKTRVYVYDNENLHIFNGSGGVLVTESVEPHNMGAIPIIQCLNNDDAFSDIQGITDLLDSLSLVVSNNTDDLQSIANAILCASGGTLSKEQIENINEFKTANLPVGAKMEWIIKNINPEATKQQIDYLLTLYSKYRKCLI